MKIAVVSDTPETLEEIRRLFHGHEHGAELSFHRRSGEKVPQSAPEADVPDLLVLDSTGTDHPDMGAIEEMTRRHPNLTVLMLCSARTEDVLLAAMRAGIREVLAWPGAKREFLATVERAKRWAAAPEARRPRGKLFAFVSGKGGSGATFLATNLGYALAAECQKKVLFIDLNLQYGDASFFLTDQDNLMSVADVARQIERLDATFLASAAVDLLPNYALLAAPEDAERAVGVTTEQVDRLLSVAVQNYDYVIVDIERSVDALGMKVLDHADLIYLVTEAMLPFIRDAKRLLHAFRQLGYRGEKIRVVLNRLEKDVGVPLKRVEKALNMPVHWTVPNDYASASAAVNQGVPIAKLAPGSPISRALRAHAKELAGTDEHRKSWFGQLFHAA